MNQPLKISFEFCDFTEEYHCRTVAELINQYICDPMGGGGTRLNNIGQLRLVDGLATHPSCFVLFACLDERIVGMAVCFINFSTFKVKSYLNIHDLIVFKDYRKKGIGSTLLNQCIKIATERDFCKVTLEVREDNQIAQTLYKSVGFDECNPVMKFWTKVIGS